ncbi:hypothetical protein GOBAR_DD16919 [Gossypium barbadense]|nr:hypothetical protein GOBAR_DD16919 [Gossypium barbadense]
MVRPTAIGTTNRSSSAMSSMTTTVTIENTSGASSSSSQPQEALVLELRPRKKKVTWKEGTVDNEFMNKKSSKICCKKELEDFVRRVWRGGSNMEIGKGDGASIEEYVVRKKGG